MNYWDTSALIPLVISEPTSHAVRHLYQKDNAVMVWWGTYIEGISALARAERAQVFPEEQLESLVDRWGELIDSAVIVEPTELVLQKSKRLLLTHPLRAADAFQLGAAIVGSRDRPNELSFYCFDRRLADAARREGFKVKRPVRV